eukprot:COSAG06_NODE_26535_length_612_cov_1.481481_1_plen_62_part_10
MSFRVVSLYFVSVSFCFVSFRVVALCFCLLMVEVAVAAAVAAAADDGVHEGELPARAGRHDP